MLKAEHAGCLFLPPFNLSQNLLFKYLDFFFPLKGPANKKKVPKGVAWKCTHCHW